MENDGWRLVSIAGSHRQFVHSTKKGRVTVAGNMGKDVPICTLKSTFRQAGLTEKE
ncbi:MAG: type II toxin-antitoxin system HicA family toxin [Candidatus Hydrogenedentes bacterium]|nr:type II toxin-antitoxin system HicA family toxin [Candidatus Hydrogenedentota bacterium]